MEKGDFIGFTFDGKHCADMGFVRISGGDRYQEDTIPQFSDKTVVVPGGDGTYFFGSNYTQRQFQIQIAFDNMTETQFRQLRTTFTKDKIGKLIFDERPYKYYMAKVQSSPQLNYICFDQEPTTSSGSEESVIIHNHNLGTSSTQTTAASSKVRVYRGEGTIQFVCYYPFARSVYKSSSSYPYALDGGVMHTPPTSGDTCIIGKNKNEWIDSVSFLSELPVTTGTSISLYNPGDMETDFKAFFAWNSKPSQIKIGTSELNFDFSLATTTDSYICINSRTNLVEGYSAVDGIQTGNLYNQCITSGDFFKIPLGTASFIASTSCASLDYDYLYY